MHLTGMHTCYRPQTKFANVMFLHVSVILSTGDGWERAPGPYPGGGGLGGSGWGWGVSSPIPRGEVERSGVGGLQAQAQGGSTDPGLPGGLCIPACTEADTPTRRLLLRTVRILLECILVALNVIATSQKRRKFRQRKN